MQNSPDAYKTIKKTSEGFYKEKGSKFIAFAFPCTNKETAKALIDKLWKANHGACHICFAWRFGVEKYEDRYSDDGEPNNSAGKPIFGQILSFGVTNIAIAVVRYYGGTNLGVGGLITAYKTASKEAMKNATIEECFVMCDFLLSYDYSDTGKVMQLLNKLNVEITNQGFENNRPTISFSVRLSSKDRVTDSFQSFPTIILR